MKALNQISRSRGLLFGWERSGRLAIVMAALVISSAVIFGVHAYHRELSKSESNLVSQFPLGIVSNVARGRVADKATTPDSGHLEGEVIRINPAGFDPKQITRSNGHFVLIVNNRSQLEGVRLRLDQESGNSLAGATVGHEVPDWIQEVNLAPGTYRLIEASHPGWSCKINIPN
jgi:hypothetical protein